MKTGTMFQYANMHFDKDANVEVRTDTGGLAETYIRIRQVHMSVAFHVADDELMSWLGLWNKLEMGWPVHSYNDTHLSPSFTAFIPGELFDELRGKVLDHLAYMEEVKV